MSLSDHAATSARRRIAVIGLGSIGGIIAGSLDAVGRHHVTACVRCVVDTFEGTSVQILVSPDFKTIAWRTLLLNAVANPITALTLQRKGVFRRDDMGALVLSALEEAAAVARADGAQLAADEA